MPELIRDSLRVSGSVVELLLFDLADNVEGARNLGMQAVQVKSPADIEIFIASTHLGN